jgi:hypothetical protein
MIKVIIPPMTPNESRKLIFFWKTYEPKAESSGTNKPRIIKEELLN